MRIEAITAAPFPIPLIEPFVISRASVRPRCFSGWCGGCGPTARSDRHMLCSSSAQQPMKKAHAMSLLLQITAVSPSTAHSQS